MANKLYPPYINGTIPAFDITSGLLKIPFDMNRSVNTSEVAGFALLVRTVASNSIIYNGAQTTTYNLSKGYTIFKLTDMLTTFNLGQSYKILIAYIASDGTIGYYSTVGIVKCTVAGVAAINNYEDGVINLFNSSLIGSYQINSDDLSEKEYSYSFIVYDMGRNILYNSGELIHNSSLDTDNELSYDSITINNFLEDNTSYLIQYTVTTLNGLVVLSPLYQIISAAFIECNEISLDVIPNYDDGYVQLTFSPVDGTPAVIGHYNLMRRSKTNNSDDYDEWVVIDKFTLNENAFSAFDIYDFTVEQGVYYQYGILQYNTYNIATKIRALGSADLTYMDFEDMYLYDGEKQLRIRYNPKVSSFKTTILSSKIETIGSKYPYIFTNGNIGYKEFPLEGLISYLMDTMYAFHSAPETYYRKSTESNDDIGFSFATDLTAMNMLMEREFKLNVLDWLNDGKPKLFRSPSEGNYIVTLMSVSLTPEDKLSRMLHTFKATAYEVAAFDYDNLVKYGFLSDTGLFDGQYKVTQLSKLLSEISTNTSGKKVITADDVGGEILAVLISNVSVGTIVSLYNDPDDVTNHADIMIGLTGSYYYDNLNEQFNTLTKIEILPLANTLYDGTITITYKTEYIGNTAFDHIKQIGIESIISKLFKGYSYSGNIMDVLVPADGKRVHNELFKIYSLVFRKNIINMRDSLETIETTYNDYNATLLYNDNNTVVINLLDIDEITYEDVDFQNITSIIIGKKVLAELIYLIKTTEYDISGYTNYGKEGNLDSVYMEQDGHKLLIYNVPAIENITLSGKTLTFD